MGDPRDPAEFLALGTAHPIDPQNVGRGTAPTRWEFADAGWALAGLPLHHELLLRHRYMGEPIHGLVVEVVGQAINTVIQWGRLDESLTVGEIRRIAAAALVEYVAPNICPKCNSRKCPVCGGKDEQPCSVCCQRCGGTGVIGYSARKRRTLMRMGKARAGHRDVSKVYDAVTAMLSEWEGAALAAVRNRLRRE